MNKKIAERLHNLDQRDRALVVARHRGDHGIELLLAFVAGLLVMANASL